MSVIPLRFPISLLLTTSLLVSSRTIHAETNQEVVVTLQEAVELAVHQSFNLRRSKLVRDDAREQVRTAFSRALPQLSGTASYTRTLEAADPFAGSSAGSSFGGLGAIPWLQYNEQARTDEDPETTPMPLEDFQARQLAGQMAAGVEPGANAFLVENGLFFGLSFSQMIYDGSVINGIRGAKANKKASEQALQAEELAVIQEVSRAFYAALLQKKRLYVFKQSVGRARSNLEDARVRAAAGDIPELQRLTAEVELANRQTDALNAEVDMRNLYDQLRALVALPPQQKLAVRGELAYREHPLPGVVDAVPVALSQRPDLAQAHTVVKVGELGVANAVSQLLPTLRLEANLSANGQIPDDRSVLISDPEGNDPFAFQQEERAFFDDTYWFPVFTVGLRLQWNLFDGLGNYSRIRRERIATRQAKVDVEQTELRVRLDVERSVRTLRITRKQVLTQESVRDLAQRNYDQTLLELQAGDVTQFDLRQASQQLDESRLNYLQAIHDYEVAWVDYQVAMGQEPAL